MFESLLNGVTWQYTIAAELFYLACEVQLCHLCDRASLAESWPLLYPVPGFTSWLTGGERLRFV